MTKSIVMATATCVELAPSPIPAEWILGGTPKAWEKGVAKSHDRISQTFVWECTAGHFKWYYRKDESVVVLSGEAFLIRPNGEEVRFGAGDVGYFPAGTTCTWRVPGQFRKVAVLREPLWRPLGYAVKVWNRLVRMIIGAGRPSLIGLDYASLSSPPRQIG